jgi:chromosome segregation ATPase
MIDVVVEAVETDSLCGFSHCRAPLPAPGPRGGRPFAYCPDRTWPGGKTCKQLAAAQDALTEALGTPADAGITSSTSAFTAAAAELAQPLGDVLAAANALRDTLAAELNIAAARVAEAEETAACERGLRQQAEEAAAAAGVEARRAADHAADVVRDATAEADRRRAERDQAVAAAAAAAEARAEAERAQARAEGVATTERERAEQTVREERDRAEAATKALAAATEKLAATRTERDAARIALDDLRTVVEERQRVADDAAAELSSARIRETELIVELNSARADLQAAKTERNDASIELEATKIELSHARIEASTANVEVSRLTTEATTTISAAERDLARLRATTTALRDVLLVPDLPAEDLRTRLLAELLTDRTS